VQLPASPRPQPAARSIAGLLAGFAILDVVLNLPDLSPAYPVGSLLGPSLDLLLGGAALLLVPSAPAGARPYLRLAICLVLVALLGYAAATRFGPPWLLLPSAAPARGAAGWALAAVLLLAAGAASYGASGMVVRGFERPVIRSVFTVVVAFCAVLQVITGRHVFAPGAIPRIAHLALAH